MFGQINNPLILMMMTMIIVIIGIIIKILSSQLNKKSSPYHYSRKQYFMTRAEHEFYVALKTAVGNDYTIFAQVHLPTIVEHKVKGQNWNAALNSINRKSVDFVLCDNSYLSPVLAIELDDKSHEREDRKERDIVVESILEEADLPLLRIENHESFDPNSIRAKILQKINSV